jgi:hypothetical protein
MNSPALKEWAVAVDALMAGETIVLLRKGGIREAEGRFSVEQRQVWLYPTYEHQKPELLKLPYGQQVQSVDPGWHSADVPIQGWADITHIFQISEAAAMSALLPFHIWNERFAVERFNWKPKHPLYVLLLRVYKLAIARSIPYRPAYGGCKSWLELDVDWQEAMATCTPVLTDDDYQQRLQQVQQAVFQKIQK